MVCLFLELSSIQYLLQHFFLHPLVLSVVIRNRYEGEPHSVVLFNTAVPFNVTELVGRTMRFVNYEKHVMLHMD